MNTKKTLFILVGPTAIGKTSVSIELAKRLNGEIISADSMQIYEGMDIGTAKITESEKEGIMHYLIDEVKPDEEFSVSDFQKKANQYIDEISEKGKLPMVVGGTGLYINSLIYELDFTTSVSNWELRDRYTNEAEQYGNEYIHDKLREVDPVSADRVHLNDTKRIIRALEVFEETGSPMSESYKNFRALNDKFNLVMIGLTMDREKLYERINKRIDIMLESGLIDEVKGLIGNGYDQHLTSMKGIGYKEVIKYLKDEFTLDETIEVLKRESRRYAKRQLTWFRRESQIHWIDVEQLDSEEVLTDIINYTNSVFEQEL